MGERLPVAVPGEAQEQPPPEPDRGIRLVRRAYSVAYVGVTALAVWAVVKGCG